VILALAVLAGCKGSPPPPPKTEGPATPGAPARTASPETPAAPAPATSRATPDGQPTSATESPWGEHTGTARVRGTLSWEGGPESPSPAHRPQLSLRGLLGTATQDIDYRVRTNEQGEFVFDRIKGGEYMLRDVVLAGPHWRLRVDVKDGEDLTLDLSLDNSMKVRDDFPQAGN
jgi:hypothetical protein